MYKYIFNESIIIVGCVENGQDKNHQSQEKSDGYCKPTACHSCRYLPSSKRPFQTGPLVIPGKSDLFMYFTNQQGEKMVDKDPSQIVEISSNQQTYENEVQMSSMRWQPMAELKFD